jgi:3-deoxy-D-manno-octulosonic-acid transferase
MSTTLAKIAYNALLPAAVGAARVSSWFMPKVREALAGRRGFRARFEAATEILDVPPVWFHVSSVGEFEQARPLMTALQAHNPSIPVALTFSSPSGFSFARRKEALDGRTNLRFIDYLPVDTRSNMRLCLDALRPRLLVLVKFDLWPNLIWETRARDIPVVLIDATLSPSSKRLSGPGRFLYRDVYASLDKILAISEEDAARFLESVPGHPAVSVVGDTRFDRVVERHAASAGTGFHYERGGGRVLIAGSTWPSDEKHLLGALHSLMASDPDLKVIIAPHEPSPGHLGPLQDWARSRRLPSCTVKGGVPKPAPRVTIIDTVGQLAEAYALADVAYVGGGFSTGVHSVIEPAIAGLPVVFGPAHDNSFEALRLIERGAGFCAPSEKEIHDHLVPLLYDDAARARAGENARAYVESQLGATEKCLAAIAEYL